MRSEIRGVYVGCQRCRKKLQIIYQKAEATVDMEKENETEGI